MAKKLSILLSSVALSFCLLAASASAEFGFQSFEFATSNADGSPATQAGSHPFQMTTSFTFNTKVDSNGRTIPSGDTKDITAVLPPGLVGNVSAVPPCGQEQFATEKAPTQKIGSEQFHDNPVPNCENGSVVGIAKVVLSGGSGDYVPIYSLAPPPDLPAEFGFVVADVPVLLAPSLHSGDYALQVSSNNTSQSLRFFAGSITIWGVPADPRHDALRGSCLEQGNDTTTGENCHIDGSPKPLLTLPTSCNGPLKAKIEATSWQEPNLPPAKAEAETLDQQGHPIGIEGCDQLAFNPTFTVAPDTSRADTPAGLTAEVKVPQEGLNNPEGFSTADIQNTTVALPQGVVINPGQAAGLQACQASQENLESEAPPTCPSGSKVGTVQIETPLLRDKLEGTIYVVQSNPPNLQLLVTAAADGVNVKLVGDVHLNETTGQLTTTFSNTPQLPFTDLKLIFSGGAQAALATPSTCGLYTTTSDFMPWSSPFQTDAFPSDAFVIASGPGGSACASPLPFSPSLIAGSTTDQAGGYSDFSLLLQRGDGQQRISTLQFKTPKGLLGMISKVALCSEAQAEAAACPAASQIGHTVVEAGPGPFPLVVPQPGQPPAPIFLTGPYKGAPYGLAIEVPLVVGPFTLETQKVRAKIEVDPHTAQLTITTNPIPSIVDGIPTDLRTINAVIDREKFIFNPTNCNAQSFSGTATSTEGATAPISSHFQMGSCQSLKFKPDFKVSTSGKTTRKNGASLDAKIVYPTAPLGANQASSQANIASVKVDLPKQLPSRLTTLQKACTAATFDSNPANCPKASVVGHATAVTPVLSGPLNGPAYFVSHGGEAFPQLIVVLQGFGVTVDLVGDTFISKAGITSSTFKQVPDVPISSFELVLPKGQFSALAANLPAKAKGNFCGQALKLPTAFTGQNGAVVHQSTKITVSGCPKHKAKKAKATQKR
jgi:hypothetical protein